jgi:hypothetical protein
MAFADDRSRAKQHARFGLCAAIDNIPQYCRELLWTQGRHRVRGDEYSSLLRGYDGSRASSSTRFLFFVVTNVIRAGKEHHHSRLLFQRSVQRALHMGEGVAADVISSHP